MNGILNLLNALNLVISVEMVAKQVDEGVNGGVNFLGADGRTYALHYRVKKLIGASEWMPVMHVENFPL